RSGDHRQAPLPASQRRSCGEVRQGFQAAAARHHRRGVRRLEEGPGHALRRRRRVRQDIQALVTELSSYDRALRSGGAKRPRLARWREPSILPGFGLSLGITLAYLGLIVILPLAALAIRPWEIGMSGVWRTLTDERVAAALRLSFSLS